MPITLDAMFLADGIVLTSRNISHPLIQEFLKETNNLGANENLSFFQMYKTNNVGETLHIFLLRNGVDLQKNPKALDTVSDVDQANETDEFVGMFARHLHTSDKKTQGSEQASSKQTFAFNEFVAADNAANKQSAKNDEVKFEGFGAGLKNAFGNPKKGLF